LQHAIHREGWHPTPTWSRSSENISPWLNEKSSIDHQSLTGQFDECIRLHVNGYHLWQYLQDRKCVSDNVWDTTINLQMFGKQHCRLPSRQQITRTKFVHDQLPLGNCCFQQAPVKDPLLSLCPWWKLPLKIPIIYFAAGYVRKEHLMSRPWKQPSVDKIFTQHDMSFLQVLSTGVIMITLSLLLPAYWNMTLSSFLSFMMHFNREPALGGVTLIKDSSVNLGERSRATISTIRNDWILRKATLD
jgi:hypothetical protein